MPADRADPGHQGPQCLQGDAPAPTRGRLSLVPTSPRPQLLQTEVPSSGAVIGSAPVTAFAGAFLGCLVTLHFCEAGFVPAIASALATILLCGPVLITRTTSLFPGELFTAIYGGTFAGMTQVSALGADATGAPVVPAGALFILLSVVTGLAFCTVVEFDTRSGRRLAGGYGGRSGAIATMASFLFVEASLRFGADGQAFRAAHGHLLDLDPRSLAVTCAASTIGMAATLAVLRRRSIASAQQAERIFIAAAIALLGLMALHLTGNDAHSLDAFYAGCFLGMSTQERLKGWIEPLLGATLLTAMLYLVRMLLPGIGGELGFAAFITVALIVALRQVVTWQVMSWRAMIWLTSDTSRDRDIGIVPKASAGGVVAGRPIRSALNVAGSAVGLLMIGWLALPGQVASEEPDLDPAEQVAEQPAPTPARIALAETNAAAVDVALSLDLPAGAVTADADAVNASTGMSREINAAATTVATTDAGAEPGRTDRAASAAPAPIDTVRHESPLADAARSHEALFAEFIRWRAAHPAAQPQLQPARRSHNPAMQMVRLTPPASIRTAPRAPVRNPAVRHVTGQSGP